MSAAAERSFGPIDFRMRFPALDGLRAIAICAVFLEHYGGGSHGGAVLNTLNAIRQYGWLGVDLFFVLSGFLITGILYDTLGDSRYFRRFFARRSLRIFPIYYLVFLVILLLTPVFQYQWRTGHLLFLIYMGNWVANRDFSLYAILSGRSHWLIASISHFWSLCVEEQFYMLWPLAVFLLRTRRKILAGAITLSALAIGLRGLEIVQSGRMLGEGNVVRSLQFRMDTLLLGGVLALLLRGPAATKVQRSCKWVFLAGTLTACAIFIMGPKASFPWLAVPGYSVIALAFAGLIGMTLREDSLCFRIFNLRPLRILGKYSYGFYIYHLLFRWMWIWFLVWCGQRFHSLAWAGIVALSTNFIVTFAVSKVSYDHFESRFLRLKSRFEYDKEVISDGTASMAK